jgi:hypothetical protein
MRNQAVEIETMTDAQLRSILFDAARMLIPSESRSFYMACARDLLRETMLSLAIQAPVGWSFPDVFVAARRPKRLRTILKLHRSTREFLDVYSRSSRLFMEIQATLLVALTGHFAGAGACWYVQQAKRGSWSSRDRLIRSVLASRAWDLLQTWDDEDLERLNLTHCRDELDLQRESVERDCGQQASEVPRGSTR